MFRHLLVLPLALALSACGGAVANLAAGPASGASAAVAPEDGIARLSASQLMAMQMAGEAVVVVDVRNKAAYESSHVKGAQNFMTDALASGAGEWPKNTTVVTYCTCVNEGSAAKAAQSLLARGYTKVYALKEGLEGWKKAGGQVDATATAPVSDIP